MDLSALRLPNLVGGVDPVSQVPDPITEYATRVLPILHGEQNRQWGHEEQLRQELSAQAALREGQTSQHPNMVFNPAVNGIQPLDAAKLAQGEEKIQGQNTRASDALNEKTQFGQTENAIKQQSANIAAFKAANPNMAIRVAKGGNFVAINPQTGKAVDSGIDSGTMSDRDKLDITGQDRLDQIYAEGQNQQKLETQKSGDASNLENQKQTGRVNLKETSTPSKPQSATQQGADYYNKAQELINSNPKFAPFIKLDPNVKGNFSITPPSSSKGLFGGSDGPDQDTYHAINQAIYGSPSTSTTSTTVAPTKTPVPQSKYKVSITPGSSTDETK